MKIGIPSLLGQSEPHFLRKNIKKITIFRQNYIYLKFQHMLLMLIRILWKTNTFTYKLLEKKISVSSTFFQMCIYFKCINLMLVSIRSGGKELGELNEIITK